MLFFYPLFNSPTEVGEAIKKAGFNVVLHATNHAADKGIEGLINCVDFWEKQEGILMAGIDKDSGFEAEIPILEFENAGFCYAGAGEESLSDIDFQVYKGETVGIIGGTGSGKSTLVNLIPRFYDVTSGIVRYHGKPIGEYPLEELRARIGVVPQRAVLFKGTIKSNLLWGNEDAKLQDMEEALTTSQSKEFVEKLEKYLDTPVAQGGKNFSGGQRQRLTIARALVRKPEILILDDSTSALDYVTDAKLRAELKKRKESMTTFIVSQRTSSIRFADKIVVLEDGKIAGLGTHKELLKSCEVYREIYDSQYQNQEEEVQYE